MKNKGITLIALIITIIILLILAGITINVLIGDNGLFNIAKDAGEKYEQAAAREKLEAVLVELQADKITNTEYNEKDYINDKLKQNNMQVQGNIVTVDGWQFEIDRSVPKIAKDIGKNTHKQLVTGITLDKTNIKIANGSTGNLVATISPSNADNKDVIWSSDDVNIANVMNGKITGVSPGKTKIRATAKDGSGIVAECEVTITGKLYLYNNGNLCTNVTGNFGSCVSQSMGVTGPFYNDPTSYTIDNRTITFDTNYIGMYLSKYEGKGIGSLVFTKDKINLKDFTSLNIKWKVSDIAMSSDSSQAHSAAVNIYDTKESTYDAMVTSKGRTILHIVQPGSGVVETVPIDITKLQNSYYIGISSAGLKETIIYEIWLEIN